MQKGLELNFPALFRRLLRRWPILLAFVLLFGALANVYGYRRAISSAERERRALEQYASELGTDMNALPEYMTAELADLRSELTEEEASFVEAVAKLYMYRMWASDRINQELIVGSPDQNDLEIVQTLYYANEGVQSAIQVMTSAEKSYYNVLVKELSDTDMSITEKDISSPGLLQPKWLVIGAVLGLLLGICVVTFAWLLSGKLRTAEDLENPFGVPVLAKIRSGKDGDLEAIAKGVSRLMQERGLERLAIYTQDSPQTRQIREKLLENLSAQKDVAGGASLQVREATSEHFLSDVTDTDAVLFVEQVGKSRYRDIEEHVSACQKFCIPTVGCIVVE